MNSINPATKLMFPKIITDNTSALGVRNRPSELLNDYINQGLELIQRANYESAIKNFQDQAVAKQAGFSLVLNKIKPTKQLYTREQIIQYLDMAAYFSGLCLNRKEIELNKLVSLSDCLLNNDFKEFIELEESLLFAEEWIHALQDESKGASISSHAQAIYPLEKKENIKPCEIEVADYFLDRGISWDFLKNTHWITRYDRKKILTQILEM